MLATGLIGLKASRISRVPKSPDVYNTNISSSLTAGISAVNNQLRLCSCLLDILLTLYIDVKLFVYYLERIFFQHLLSPGASSFFIAGYLKIGQIMFCIRTVTALAVHAFLTSALKYDPDQVLWNLNQNQTATSGLDYWGEWQNHCKSKSSSALRSV